MRRPTRIELPDGLLLWHCIDSLYVLRAVGQVEPDGPRNVHNLVNAHQYFQLDIPLKFLAHLVADECDQQKCAIRLASAVATCLVLTLNAPLATGKVPHSHRQQIHPCRQSYHDIDHKEIDLHDELITRSTERTLDGIFVWEKYFSHHTPIAPNLIWKYQVT